MQQSPSWQTSAGVLAQQSEGESQSLFGPEHGVQTAARHASPGWQHPPSDKQGVHVTAPSGVDASTVPSGADELPSSPVASLVAGPPLSDPRPASGSTPSGPSSSGGNWRPQAAITPKTNVANSAERLPLMKRA